MRLVSLRNGELRLDIAPHIGGSLASFYQQDGMQRIDLLRPASSAALQAGDPLGMASFPLLPFSNRLRHGRFHFAGKEVKLPLNVPGEPHALHGLGWQMPWTVREADRQSAILELVYRGKEWPWHFRARQSLQLHADRLCMALELRNESGGAMPFGLGHHPYFPCNSRTRLQFDASALWETDTTQIPQRPVRAALLDTLAGGTLVNALNLDTHFSGWQGRAVIDLHHDASAQASASLLLQAEPPLDFLVLYTPPGAGYFCAEPVSQCADWLHLPASVLGQAGGGVLQPGLSSSVQMTLIVA
jgi:aldose 1-epimerase